MCSLFIGDRVYQNKSIDTTFDPPLFSLDSIPLSNWRNLLSSLFCFLPYYEQFGGSKVQKTFFMPSAKPKGIPNVRAGLLKSLWGLGTEEEEGYRTGPPGYIGWRNSFLGIDSGAPYSFKNTGSGFLEVVWFDSSPIPLPIGKLDWRHKNDREKWDLFIFAILYETILVQ